MGYGRNYRHGRHDKGNFQHESNSWGQKGTDYDSLKRTFLDGNFSSVRETLEKVGKQRLRHVLSNLYNEVKREAGKFYKWNERMVITNAAIVAAYAVVTDLKTTQIRKTIEMAKSLHTEVQIKNNSEGIRDKISKEALRMNMLMAYYAGKNKSVLPIQEVLEPVLNWLSNNPTPKNFEKVYTFFEAIVAYHRYFGGKEK